MAPGTSYLRYRGDYILPATHLPAAPQGPAVWRVSGVGGLSMALNTLLQEPLERRSRGHAAAQVGGLRGVALNSSSNSRRTWPQVVGWLHSGANTTESYHV